MTLPRDLAVTHAWRGAFVSAALTTVGMPCDFLLAHELPDMPWYPSALSVLVGVGLMVLLLKRRQRATVRFSSNVFLINTVATLVALWITSGYWAVADEWTPFQANKLGALAVAALAPDLVVGLAAIAGFAATAIGKFYVLDPGIRLGFPVGEPWVILFYALFGAVLLAYRLRGVTLERETLRLQAEAAAAEQTARTFLLLRDYANTPVQAIIFAVEMLGRQHPELKPELAHIERALDRLKELSSALTRYESAHRWIPGDESPDVATLAKRLPGSEFRI